MDSLFWIKDFNRATQCPAIDPADNNSTYKKIVCSIWHNGENFETQKSKCQCLNGENSEMWKPRFSCKANIIIELAQLTYNKADLNVAYLRGVSPILVAYINSNRIVETGLRARFENISDGIHCFLSDPRAIEYLGPYAKLWEVLNIDRPEGMGTVIDGSTYGFLSDFGHALD